MFRGAGQQAIGMGINVGVFYPFVVPIMTVGVLRWGFDAQGIWAALASGQLAAAVLMTVAVLRMEWRCVTA